MTTTQILLPHKTTKRAHNTALSAAALIAGVGLLIMAIAAPFAELYAYPRLVVAGNAAETTQNILANQALFRAVITGYLVTFLCDLLVTWALYIFLKPVNQSLSLLTALFRLVYTVIALVALLNLVTILRLSSASDALTTAVPDQVMFLVRGFKSQWYFGLSFFGIHLGLLGYLVFQSSYIPKILGAFLVLAGIGYLLNGLRPLLFPALNIDFAQYTFFGELIFMLWLLIKGSSETHEQQM